MASSVNVKLGVSGVAQFKSAMKDSQAAVRTLDAELKKNEQQYRLTGDAQTYMQQKSDLLKQQIEAQREVVRQAEQALSAMSRNGVNPASQAFQNMQRTLAQAQGSLMGMQADLNNVATAADGAQEETNNLGGSLREMNRNIKFDSLNKGIDGITGKLKSAAKAAWDFGQKMLTATLGAGEWADQLATEAAIYQVSPEDLQRMRYTARMIDTDVDAIIDARNRFKKNKATEGTEFMGIFADEDVFRGGYDIRAKNWEDAFWDTGEAIMAMSDAEEQEAYAQRAFGRGWHELIPLFSAGREEYEKMNASWHVVSDDNLKKLTDMDDEVQKMSANWETLQNTFLATLASTLTPLLEKLNTFLEKFNEYLESPEGQAKMEQFGEALSGLFDGLLELDPEEVMNAIKDAIDGIIRAFEWIDQHKGDIVKALEIIGGAFVALNLGQMATNLASIVMNFGNLRSMWPAGNSTTQTPTLVPTTTPQTTTPQTTTPQVPQVPPTIPDEPISTGWSGLKILDWLGPLAAVTAWDRAVNQPLRDKLNAELLTVDQLHEETGLSKTDIFTARAFGKDPYEWAQMAEEWRREDMIGPSGGRAFEPVAPVYEGRGGLFGGRMNDLFAAGGFGKNSLTSDDISEFRGLPAMIQAAVRAGMQEATVYAIVPSEAVGEIGSQVGEAMWGTVTRFAH